VTARLARSANVLMLKASRKIWRWACKPGP
jgi:hypothetical protein